MEKYVMLGFPEIQQFMEHPRWDECIFCIEIEGHPCDDSTYAVPEDLYNEVNKITSTIYSKDDIINKLKSFYYEYHFYCVGLKEDDEFFKDWISKNI